MNITLESISPDAEVTITTRVYSRTGNVRQVSQTLNISKLEEARKGELNKTDISQIENEPEDFKRVRYSSFISLWSHHNTTQLQWPAVILGALLLVISNVVLKSTSEILNWRGWVNEIEYVIGIGAPLIFVGLGILPILYTMRRAGIIMLRVEKELDEIEKSFGRRTNNFSKLNHPHTRVRGPKAMRITLTVLSFLMVAFGLLISAGLRRGTYSSLILLILYILFWLRKRRNKSLDRSAGNGLE